MSSHLNYGLRVVNDRQDIWMVTAYDSVDGPVAGVCNGERVAAGIAAELGGDPQYREVKYFKTAPVWTDSPEARKADLLQTLAQKRHLHMVATEEAHRLNIEIGAIQDDIREERY